MRINLLLLRLLLLLCSSTSLAILVSRVWGDSFLMSAMMSVFRRDRGAAEPRAEVEGETEESQDTAQGEDYENWETTGHAQVDAHEYDFSALNHKQLRRRRRLWRRPCWWNMRSPW